MGHLILPDNVELEPKVLELYIVVFFHSVVLTDGTLCFFEVHFVGEDTPDAPYSFLYVVRSMCYQNVHDHNRPSALRVERLM